MSNPYQPPQAGVIKPQPELGVQRVAIRPLERLSLAKQRLGDQYWLFVGT